MRLSNPYERRKWRREYETLYVSVHKSAITLELICFLFNHTRTAAYSTGHNEMQICALFGNRRKSGVIFQQSRNIV